MVITVDGFNKNGIYGQKNCITYPENEYLCLKILRMGKEITYVDAYNELQEIVKQMENTSVNVDELSEKIKRAHQLLQICQKKLSSVEEDVNEIVKELEQ